jgi:hypothetical protein
VKQPVVTLCISQQTIHRTKIVCGELLCGEFLCGDLFCSEFLCGELPLLTVYWFTFHFSSIASMVEGIWFTCHCISHFFRLITDNLSVDQIQPNGQQTLFWEHIFEQCALLKSLCRPSVRLFVCPSVRLSVCSSVVYFLAAITPRELKFCTMLRWYLDTNVTVRNFESVA